MHKRLKWLWVRVASVRVAFVGRKIVRSDSDLLPLIKPIRYVSWVELHNRSGIYENNSDLQQSSSQSNTRVVQTSNSCVNKTRFVKDSHVRVGFGLSMLEGG
jgi:hypothetical protein